MGNNWEFDGLEISECIGPMGPQRKIAIFTFKNNYQSLKYELNPQETQMLVDDISIYIKDCGQKLAEGLDDPNIDVLGVKCGVPT